MKKTCGNEVQLASIPEGMAALVKGTQKTLDEWKTRSKRKRFRCENIPGTILALCNDLQSRLLRQASRRPGSSKRSLPSLKSSRTSFFRLGYKAGDSGRKQGFWKSRTADACLPFHHLLFSLVVMLMSTSKTITVERFDLSLGLTHLFCQNSDYETLRLINDGINLEKKTAIGILQVFCASQS